MGRNDGVLVTGQNSGSLVAPRAAKIQEKRALDKEQRLELQSKLYPASEIIFTILDYEKALVTSEIANLPIGVETSNENVKEVLMAYQRNLRMIKRLHKKFERALAAPQLTAEEVTEMLKGFEDEDDDESEA